MHCLSCRAVTHYPNSDSNAVLPLGKLKPSGKLKRLNYSQLVLQDSKQVSCDKTCYYFGLQIGAFGFVGPATVTMGLPGFSIALILRLTRVTVSVCTLAVIAVFS